MLEHLGVALVAPPLLLYGTPWWLMRMIVLAAFYISPTYAMTQGLAAPRMRALASAVILFVLNLVGLGLGPQIVGILNDALHARLGDEAIRFSMAGVWLVNLWAIGHSLLAARTLGADLERSQTPS